ncbi:MAG: hypothetical protein J6B19_03805 [Lachnospiraceae bacterium]|nr:hypothetical protein [Lachnospiraceae bacterium]
MSKYTKTVGRGMMIVAIVILSINLLCRFADAEKSKEHIRVTGTVSNIQETTEWIRAGNRSVQSSNYSVWVRFHPQDSRLLEEVIVENHIYDLFSLGDTVVVLYPKSAVYKAYTAKKDWLTGDYLPMSKDYNMPLIIAFILLIAGFLFYKNIIDFDDLK